MKRSMQALMGFAAAATHVVQAAAQRPQPAPAYQAPVISAEAAVVYEELSPRFAGEVGLVQGWFRDRAVLYYDFGSVPTGVAPARVYWPIYGFDAAGNPVAMRGQRPIFSTIPGMNDYTGLWRLIYVVTADNFQPNQLRDTAGVTSAIRRRRARVRETDMVLNLPVVPRGTRLARDTTTGMSGWYEGRDIQFFDFGAASAQPAPMWRFSLGTDQSGSPIVLEAQNGILDSVPVSPAYPDLWDIRFVRVDTSYRPNSIKSFAALRSAQFVIDSPKVVRNLPVTIMDGAAIPRTPSPLTRFADLRSPFPPAPTKPPSGE